MVWSRDGASALRRRVSSPISVLLQKALNQQQSPADSIHLLILLTNLIYVENQSF